MDIKDKYKPPDTLSMPCEPFSTKSKLRVCYGGDTRRVPSVTENGGWDEKEEKK